MSWWQQKATDPAEVVKKRLDRIEQENQQSVQWDHRFAFVSIVTIAITAVLGIARTAVAALVAGRIQGVDAINLCVAFLFVLVMNRGLLAAARNIRRKEARREQVFPEDRATMWGVALIESVSLGYMLFNFEHPADIIQWILLIARASVIPYATIYLEIQRQHPIDPQDIAIQTEIASGIGLLRDIVTIANDRSVPTGYKVGMYKASADLTVQQAVKLDAMKAAADALQVYKHPETVVLVDVQGQPLLVENDEGVQTLSTNSNSTRKRTAIDIRQKEVFKHLDAHTNTSARELARRFEVSVTTAQMDIRAWKAARYATQQSQTTEREAGHDS
jgi:uncharacterized protein GlcG (DUF336 family)